LENNDFVYKRKQKEMFYLFCIFKRQNMRIQKVLLRILFLQDLI